VERVYASCQARLHRAVGTAIRDVGAELVEDACQDAWLAAILSQDRIWGTEDEQLYAYVKRSAIRRGWKLAADRRRTVELTVEQPDVRDVHELVLARDRLSLAGASERQRRMLWLLGAGFSHAEIAQVIGATMRTVERQIRRGRSALRA
jgi:DNA-directed RNA polymerase specialized sigma24 family protein